MFSKGYYIYINIRICIYMLFYVYYILGPMKKSNDDSNAC